MPKTLNCSRCGVLISKLGTDSCCTFLREYAQYPYHVKGGEVETRIVRDPSVKESMLEYLRASGRLETIQEEDPIWTRHDRA